MRILWNSDILSDELAEKTNSCLNALKNSKHILESRSAKDVVEPENRDIGSAVAETWKVAVLGRIVGYLFVVDQLYFERCSKMWLVHELTDGVRVGDSFC